MHSLSRRSFLTALGASAATLPFLDIMPNELRAIGNAHADPSAIPKRLIIMWHPNGTVPEQWKPIGTPSAFQLSAILKPLEPHKADLVIIDGLDALSAYQGPGDAHQKGTGQCLTGTPLQEGNFAGADGLSAGWANGISIDQAIADAIGNTRFRSLELGVQVNGANVNAHLAYRGPGQPLPPQNSPAVTFERLFADPKLTPEQRRARTEQRGRVLNATAERYRRLIPHLGSVDRQRLLAHLSAIEEIEERLNTGSSTCGGPAVPDGLNLNLIENIPQIGQLQIDIMVAAMACDLTRVGTLMWMSSATDKTYPWLGIHDAHHELAHAGDSDTVAQGKLTKIYNWYATQFAYLLSKLKSIREPDGKTMLDNSLVLWVSEHSRGNVHNRRELPYVAAGKAGGAMRTGRWLQLSGDVPHNNLWVSCLNLFGVRANRFGHPDFCTGPLAGLL